MSTYEQMLVTTHKNLNILQEREAKYAGNPPLELIHQIDDHKKAVVLTEQVKAGQISEAEWQEALQPLLIEMEQRTGEAAITVTIGDVNGNIQGSNIAGHDININYYFGNEQPEPDAEFTPLPFEPKTVLIPAGPFLMGSEPGKGIPKWECPQHEVDLPAYKIGTYPVTNEQYHIFIQETDGVVSAAAGWQGLTPPSDKLKHPIKGVTWHDALTYCQWLSQRTGRNYMLPSEAQWEKAAKGSDDRLYPWGNEWQPDRCNHRYEESVPVDAYPPQNEFGCYDLVGNVREWTTTIWGKRMAAPDVEFQYPWIEDHRRDDVSNGRHLYRVYRGGASTDAPSRLRCSARYGFDPEKTGERRKRHGFRVVLNL